MGAIEVDDTHWPVVIETFDGAQTDRDIDRWWERMRAVHDRAEPYVALVILRSYATSMAHLRQIAAHAQQQRSAIRELCRGTAIVVSSPAFRFVLASYYSISRTKVHHPIVTHESVATAGTWIRARLQELGLRVPSHLEEAAEPFANPM